MKLCIIIHGTIGREGKTGYNPHRVKYIKTRLREGAKIVHISSSKEQYSEFKRDLKAHGIPPKNVARVLPAEALYSSRFGAYTKSFGRFLNSLNPGKGPIVVELSGGAAEICFENLSPFIIRAITNKFGDNRVKARTFLSQVSGIRSLKTSAHPPPENDFRLNSLPRQKRRPHRK